MLQPLLLSLLTTSVPSFEEAWVLFQKEKYERAQHHFERYHQAHPHSLRTTEAEYYAALCATRLNRPDGEARLQALIKAHPHHPKAALAHYHLGHHHFTHQDFAKSITHYKQVAPDKLDQDQQATLQYHLAYAHLSEKDFAQARTHFNAIKTHPNPYRHAASYYAAYIALKHQDYEAALQDLKQANENDTYKPIVPYLAAQIYYQQKRYQELIAYTQAAHSTGIALRNEEEITLLTAEAHLLTQQYATAAQQYEEYIAHQDFTVSSEILYRTAYALYQANEAHKALKYFKELAWQKDAIGQKASYYAGILYQQASQQTQARTAFHKAQQTDFHPKIKEDATYRYAQLSYQLGHYTNTIEALQTFPQTYPNSPHLADAHTLLSQAYLHTNDYDQAIAHIEATPHPTPSSHKAYQKATFYSGSQHYNSAAYEQAIQRYQQSLQHPQDPTIALQAHLWLAESQSALQRYTQAIPTYQHILQHTPPHTAIHQQAHYGLAHAYFHTQAYAQALPHFTHIIRQEHPLTPTPWRQDALLRIADCYYATKQYAKALQHYHKAAPQHAAHAHYQKGIIHNILGNEKEAQANLKIILDHHTQTIYHEKALLQTAHITLAHNHYAKAIQQYTQFIQQKPHSPQQPDAHLSRAIAHVNQGHYPAAALDYQHLLQTYPNHPSAQSALLELPKVLAHTGETDKLEQYLTAYKAAHPDDETLAKVQFETGKSHFYEQRYTTAIQQLTTFTHSYPQSRHTPEAHFLIAEAYYRQKKVPQAQAQYQAAQPHAQPPHYSKILRRLGTLAHQQQDYAQALHYYQQLHTAARNKKEQHHALAGIMKANHALQHYAAVQEYAKRIIAQGNITIDATSQATLYLGKAAMQQGQTQEAQTYFRQTIQTTQNHHAAEAQYHIAQLHHNAQQYQTSLEALFELNKQYPTHQQWTNQGYLLMADNYLALEDYFQAKATLQSIIDHAQDPITIASAQEKLAQIPENTASEVQIATPEEKDTDQ